MVQDRVQCWVIVNTVMNFWDPWTAWHFLSASHTLCPISQYSFWRFSHKYNIFLWDPLNIPNCLWYQVLMLVKVMMLLYWVVTPCGLIGRYSRFGEIYWIWRQYVSPKWCYLPTSPHGITTQKNNIIIPVIFIITSLKGPWAHPPSFQWVYTGTRVWSWPFTFPCSSTPAVWCLYMSVILTFTMKQTRIPFLPFQKTCQVSPLAIMPVNKN
jgi:hypothetical protein